MKNFSCSFKLDECDLISIIETIIIKGVHEFHVLLSDEDEKKITRWGGCYRFDDRPNSILNWGSDVCDIEDGLSEKIAKQWINDGYIELVIIYDVLRYDDCWKTHDSFFSENTSEKYPIIRLTKEMIENHCSSDEYHFCMLYNALNFENFQGYLFDIIEQTIIKKYKQQ